MFWARRKSFIHNHIHHHPQPHHTQLLTFPQHMKKMNTFIYIILFFGGCGFAHDHRKPNPISQTIAKKIFLSPNWFCIPPFFFKRDNQMFTPRTTPQIFLQPRSHITTTISAVNIFFLEKVGAFDSTHAQVFTTYSVNHFFVSKIWRAYFNWHEMIIYI